MKIILPLLLIIMIANVRARPVDEDNPDNQVPEGEQNKESIKDPGDPSAPKADGSATTSDVPPNSVDADVVDKTGGMDNGDSPHNSEPTSKQEGTKTPSPRPTGKTDKTSSVGTKHAPSPSPSSSPPQTPSPHPQSTSPTPDHTVSAAKASDSGSTVQTTPKQKPTVVSTHRSTRATTQPPSRKTRKPHTPSKPSRQTQPDTRSKIFRTDTYGQTVEKSDNNTMVMNGTTFRAAVRLLSEKFKEDLSYQKNPVFQRLKKSVMNAVTSVYDGYRDFKQIAIIGFTETPSNDTDNDKRDSILSNDGGNPVIADFYLRFFTYGNHLIKLTEAIKSERLGTLPVSPKFVKAYTAEPKGRVCTPDCRVRCFSYCDDGCCTVNLIPRVMSFAEVPHADMQWSSAPIAPHSQPFEEVPCIGTNCLGRSAKSPTPGCVGAECGRQLGQLSENTMYNQGPTNIKACKGDPRCEAMLVRRVSIMKSQLPIKRYMAPGLMTVSAPGVHGATEFMTGAPPLPVMDQSVIKSIVMQPCVYPTDLTCAMPNTSVQAGENALQRKMNLVPGYPMNVPIQQNPCPPVCAAKCLVSCPNTCCYLKPPESSLFLDQVNN